MNNNTSQNVLIKVVPFAKNVKVEPILGGLKVWLTAKPVDNQANNQLIEVLADYYHCAKSKIQIKSGGSGRTKLISIIK